MLCIVAVLSVFSLLGPAAARAALTDDVVANLPDAGSVVEAPSEALPELPVPVETPDLPEVPLPSVPKPPPRSSQSPPAPIAPAGETSVRALGDGADEQVGVDLTGTEQPGASPVLGAHGEPGASPAVSRRGRQTIGPAETAPLRRIRAYIWPAIALGFGDALVPLLDRLDRLAAVQVPDVIGLFTSAAGPSPVGGDLSSQRSGQLGQSLRSPAGAALPEGGLGLLAILAIGVLIAVGLVSLARLVVGEELFEAGHWPGHRG